jgi:hypothetical protein
LLPRKQTPDQNTFFIPDPWAEQKAIADSLKGCLAKTLSPASNSPSKMWTALVLVWISSVLLPRSHMMSAEPRK